MIRPASFRSNEQTAVNNFYQKSELAISNEEVTQKAMLEFDAFALLLKEKGVNVLVLEDSDLPSTPDSIFPNNWISLHGNHSYVLYPMFAPNRRLERSDEVIRTILSALSLNYKCFDFSSFEAQNRFLEGTGSLVLDRENRLAYAAISARTDADLVMKWCEELGYKPVIFHANQTMNGKRLPIYHTNVMMCIGTNFCVICTDSIDDMQERALVISNLKNTHKEIILITEKQVDEFAGNMLELRREDDNCIVMSTRAYHSLSENQLQLLRKHGELVFSNLDTIETYGGGSARCMLAELF